MIKYTASNFSGNCEIDEDFKPYLDHMNEVAKEHGIKVIVTSSYRPDTNVKGAIVTPAQRSNHLIGYAIDCNLQDIKTGEYFNSVKMGDGVGLDESFIKDVEKTGLRWGGRFKAKDVVHFDYPLNINNPKLWQEKYNKIHNV